MSPELEKKLFEKYPKIFPSPDRETEEGKLRSCMFYGFSCGDGWFTIIDTLCRNIQSHVDQLKTGLEEEEADNYQVVAEQVKEKYGSLRFYASNADDYTYGMIAMAESMSSKICEYCGSKAEITTKGWIKNLCNDCNIKTKN